MLSCSKSTKTKRTLIPASMLIIILLSAVSAALSLAAISGLIGRSEVAVSDSIFFETVEIDPHSSEPANSSATVRLSNDRRSYTVGFLTDQGDTVIFRITITNLAGVDAIIKILTQSPLSEQNGSKIEPIEVGYSLSNIKIDFGNTLRRTIRNEWVIHIRANSTQEFYQWIYTSSSTLQGQYQIVTSIQLIPIFFSASFAGGGSSGTLLSQPISWTLGQDDSAAWNMGFVSEFASNATSFALTLNGLSGGTVIIDKLLSLTTTSEILSFKMKISSALSGTLSPQPATLKLRFWTGDTAPTIDDGPGVVAVLDLTASAGTETATAIPGNQTVFVQLVCTLQTNTAGSSTICIEPSSIITT